MNGNRKKAAAFTLIEIMVVVAILVILIAILIPALGAARNTAKKTATTAQMHGIAMACESYYQNFEAYPGAIADTAYDGSGGPPTAAPTVVPFSSTQSMLVSLSRAFYTAAPTSPPGVTATQVGTLPFWTCDSASITPIDYASNRSYDAFLNVPGNQLSNNLSPAATQLFTNSAANATDVPVIVDNAYSTDALPILYYRQARKYDPSVQNPAAAGQYMNAVGDTTTGAGKAKFAAFYGATNDWLFYQQAKTFASPLPTPSRTFLNAGFLSAADAVQSTTAAGTDIGPAAATTSPNTAALQQLLFNQVGATAAGPVLAAKGSFVLISAGPDRVYGPRSNLPKTNLNYSVSNTTADDIVVAGGN